MNIYFIMFFMASFLWLPLFATKSKVNYKHKGRREYLTYNSLNNNHRLLYLMITFGFMFILSSIRSCDVGTDTQTYINTFLRPEVLSLKINGNYKFERGYAVLVHFLRLFTTNYRFFLIITSLIIYLGYAIFIYFNSYNVAASTIMFFPLIYWSTMSALRQNIAAVIAINSIYFIRRKKIFPAVLVILIACQFHKTALVFLAVIPLIYYCTNIYKVIFSSCIMAICALFSMEIFKFIVRYYPIYNRYLDSDMFKGVGNRGTIWLMFLGIVIFGLYCLNQFRNILDKHVIKDMYILISISILSIFIGLLGTQYGIFSRVARYFTPFLMLLIPAILEKYFIKNSKMVIYILFTLCMSLYFYIVLRNDVNGIIPYICYF